MRAATRKCFGDRSHLRGTRHSRKAVARARDPGRGCFDASTLLGTFISVKSNGNIEQDVYRLGSHGLS